MSQRRISNPQSQANFLKQGLLHLEPTSEVYLFGSRALTSECGGDIDILCPTQTCYAPANPGSDLETDDENNDSPGNLEAVFDTEIDYKIDYLADILKVFIHEQPLPSTNSTRYPDLRLYTCL